MEARREVELAATVDEVWALLSDAEGLAAWLGGDLQVEAGDVRPGARGTFTEPDGTVRHVLVDDVDPGRSVSWTWWTDDEDDPPSGVSIAVESTGDEAGEVEVVRVVVVERQLTVTGSVPRAQACAASRVG